ncbi:M23 family metallopeptidase [Paenibacillus chartarius]|uniref:M23 family metallopeptidase n=1 Tax=Paenibacillus chartarius TaxID=747481 RepID=A0ABV6DSI1_9BACL
MKQRWWRKKLTLMLIAGANRRIVRLKLPEISLFAVPTVLVTIAAGGTLAFVLLHDRYETTQAQMQKQFEGTEQQLQHTIESKDAELVHLQASLIDLTQQAEQFKAKVEEIKQLKQVLAVMTDGATASAANKPEQPQPVGGTELTPTAADVAQTIVTTKMSLTSMINDMNGLMASLAESEAKLAEAQHIRDITPTLWPTRSRTVTSGFGIRLDPFSERPAMHSGIDFAGNTNDPVYAAAEGTVAVAGYDGQKGNYVIINHGRGLATEYMHMTKLSVKSGQLVKKGQQVGFMGSTGRSTGTHLHYEVHKNGSPVDPRPYLVATRKENAEP